VSILVGDIGGTSSRFGIAHDPKDPAAVSDVRIFRNAEHAGLAQVISSYLDACPQKPAHGVVAVAAPITGGRVQMTNLSWSFSNETLSASAGFPIDIINDFEAMACALPYLGPDDLRLLGEPKLHNRASKAVLGPGTGMGVAGLVRWNNRWVPVSSEGGHVDLAPFTPEEVALFEILRRTRGRISAEDVISGPGLVRLHAARIELLGLQAEPLDAPGITKAATEKSDPVVGDTVRMFLNFFARFAGDVALMFAADGGVYLYGGVTQRLSSLIDPVAFRAAFEAKDPHEAWLRTIAIAYIADATPALIGSAAFGFDRFE
jgi:glucokinase